ncbi:vegetative cell wall protein gp1 [Triticum aestivum]|uniref:vegetative cell wall protein gp1 n=1 Tax=Triticum aestivum TaxID=4565 RepID=UPI001D01ED03|nr:vegetative cell wall protein gp1-like [Triticum aestivum]
MSPRAPHFAADRVGPPGPAPALPAANRVKPPRASSPLLLPRAAARRHRAPPPTDAGDPAASLFAGRRRPSPPPRRSSPRWTHLLPGIVPSSGQPPLSLWQEPTQCSRTGTTENKNAAAPHPKLSRSHRWSALPSAPPRPAQRAARPPAPTRRRPCTFPSAPPPRLPQRAAAPPSTSAVDLPSSACFLPALPGSRRCAQRFLPAPPCIGEVRRRVRILQLHPIAAVQRLQLLSLASAARCKVDPNLLQMPVAAMSYDAADGHLPRRAGSDPTAMAASSADELAPVVLEAVVSYGWGSKQRLERSRVYLPGCLLRKRLELHEFAIFCSLGVLLLELVSVQQPA